MENISGNEESTIFDRSFDILASKLKSLYLQKKLRKKRLGNKFSFWRSNDNSSHIYKCIFFVMTFLKDRSLKQL